MSLFWSNLFNILNIKPIWKKTRIHIRKTKQRILLILIAQVSNINSCKSTTSDNFESCRFGCCVHDKRNIEDKRCHYDLWLYRQVGWNNYRKTSYDLCFAKIDFAIFPIVCGSFFPLDFTLGNKKNPNLLFNPYYNEKPMTVLSQR